MTSNEIIDTGVHGSIEPFMLVAGDVRRYGEQCNMTVNSLNDAMALALGSGLRVNGMYLVYRNDPGATPIAPAKTNTAATYAAATANRGLVRVSTIGTPAISSGDALYTGNKVTVIGVTDGTAFFSTVPVIDGTSVFYHTALVCIQDFDNQSRDIIISCADLTNPLTKLAGAQIGNRWTLTFAIP